MKTVQRFVLLAGALLLLIAPVRADVKLPAVFNNNMVLQRDIQIPVWGWADATEEVTVKIADASVTAQTGAEGKWIVRLPRLKAGGPHVMTVTGKNKIELMNVLIGEVWICSGQSNMEWSVNQSADPEIEKAAADFPKIRLFHMAGPKRIVNIEPQKDVAPGIIWTECRPATVGDFSAVAYFFGRHLHKELDVPIGLINTSWGGTRIEPWTPPEGFAGSDNDQVKQIGAAALKQRGDYARANEAAKSAGQNPPAPGINQGSPTAIYNAMVHPLVPFAIRGAIWYQGESNRGEGMLYAKKMEALISGWRKVWNQGEFPFYFVQLAPYTYGGSETALPEIWEAQTSVLSMVKNTGMAVTTDITNLKDIHPKNKQDVGKRLALWALAKTYDRNELVYSGPLYKSMKVDGGKIRVEFDHVGSGLVSRDGKPLSWFTIAGEDGNFVEAQAEIQGTAVVVWSDQVKQPKTVRLGWHQLAEPNLMNKEGLPASPFRAGQ